MELKKIHSNIKKLGKMTSNVNELVQETAVGILEHAAGDGNGDVTAALDLARALPNSFRRAMLVNWFAHFGNIGINMDKGDVRRFKRDSKRYRAAGINGFDIDGARANPWFNEESVPGQQREYVPNTLLELSQNIVRFADRTEKQLDETYPDSDVPRFVLSDDDKAKVLAALEIIRALGAQTVLSAEANELRKRADELEAQAAEYEAKAA